MAWIVRKSIRQKDTLPVRWPEEAVAEILQASAIVVSKYCDLLFDYPYYISIRFNAVGLFTPYSNYIEEAA